MRSLFDSADVIAAEAADIESVNFVRHIGVSVVAGPGHGWPPWARGLFVDGNCSILGLASSPYAVAGPRLQQLF